MSDLIRVENLTIVARGDDDQEKTIVKNIRLSIPRGEVLALIGESGSGKTTIALSLMGFARKGCRIDKGSIFLEDIDLMSLSQADLRSLRGRRISYVAQSAASSFNPSMKIMNQILESTQIHQSMSRKAAEAKAVDLFRALALPNPETIGSRYPHQVSGGQLQRLMAAMAMITDPELIIFDEPTTALDVTTQIDVLRAFKQAVRERGITAVYVSHDLAVVAQMADHVVVLNNGEIREVGSTAQILHAPIDDYTKQLIAAARPALNAVKTDESDDLLLSVEGLAAGYGKIDRDGRPAIPILQNINLSIKRGSTLGVIGESGSGKSTLARAIAGLLPSSAGTVRLADEVLPNRIEQRSADQLKRVQIVFQNADTALNPAHSVRRILTRPLVFYHGMTKDDSAKRVNELLDLVHLPASIADQPCARLSGGQKQRVNLARALAAEPDLILCDEVTSALDTVVAAAILDLLAELQRELGVSFMFISHDITTLRAVCDQIIVLYAGQKVEEGSRQHFAQPPFHPYTNLLINSVPELEQGWLERNKHIRQTISVNADDQQLCGFLDRCSLRIDGKCNKQSPPWVTLSQGNEVNCHLNDEELQQHSMQTPTLKPSSLSTEGECL